MAQNFKTGLVIQGAPLPPNFRGTPQQLFESMLDRMEIVSPFGITSFVIGPNKPAYNAGPWLKNGTMWYVWSDDDADYIPLDITDSQKAVYIVAKEDPDSLGNPDNWTDIGSPPLWFKLNDAANRVIGTLFYVGGRWQSLGGTSGPTSERPANPAAYEKYFDTTINVELIFERSQWRTVSGSPGDVKAIRASTAVDAVLKNPGWEILGTGETDNTAWRGCVIGQATKDASGGVTDLNVNSPTVSEHAALSVTGKENTELTVANLPEHSHLTVADEESTAGNPTADTRVARERQAGGDRDYQLEQSSLEATIGKSSVVGDGDGFSVVQPTLYLWHITKL
jgi:hypothetical protein